MPDAIMQVVVGFITLLPCWLLIVLITRRFGVAGANLKQLYGGGRHESTSPDLDLGTDHAVAWHVPYGSLTSTGSTGVGQWSDEHHDCGRQ